MVMNLFERVCSMKTVELKNLSVDFIREMRDNKEAFQIHNPGGDLFQHAASETSDKDCLLVDMQSANVMVLIYDALKPENQQRFNRFIHNEMNLANFIDHMWEMVA